MSWDRTWSEMSRLLAYAVQTNQNREWRGKGVVNAKGIAQVATAL